MVSGGDDMVANSSVFGGTLNDNSLFGVGEIQIVGNANNTFVAVWDGANGLGTDPDSGIAVRVFDFLGRPLISEGQGNLARTDGRQYDPSLTSLSDGGAAFVYTSEFSATDNDIYYERRDAFGTLVNNGNIEFSSSDDRNADIADFGNGRLFVTYTSRLSNGDVGLNAKIVAADGTVSARIIVDNLVDAETDTAVTTLNDQRAVVAYVEANGSDVRATFIGQNAFGAGTLLIDAGGEAASDVDVAALSNGNFVVAWTETVGTSVNSYFTIRDSSGGIVRGKTLVDGGNGSGRDPSI